MMPVLQTASPMAKRGIFGNNQNRRLAMMPDGEQAPPIADSPAPPRDWAAILGPDMMGALSPADPYASRGIGASNRLGGSPSMAQPLPGEVLPPMPPMRRATGLFGNVAGPAPVTSGMAEPDGTATAQPKGKKGIDWRMIAGIVGDALGGLNGQAPLFAQNMWRLRQQQAEHQDRMAQMREQTRLKLSEPDYATVNNRRVRIDPATGQADVLYQAPQDFEDYATALGAIPGTDEYVRLVQDYALRGSGPTATENYNLREDWRQGNRLELEGARQGNRRELEGVRFGNRARLRQTPTYGQAHPRPKAASKPTTIRNRATGETMVLRNGQWVKQ